MRANRSLTPVFSETSNTNDDASTKEKMEILTELICREGDDPVPRSAALLVLMATLEDSRQPKVLANHVKHLAFTRCGELNCFGMVDSEIRELEGELLAASMGLS